MAGVEVLKPQLKKAIQTAETDKEPDNPIYRVVTETLIKEKGITNTESYILKRFDDLQYQLTSQIRMTI